jgi:hypothetical protein
MEQYQIIKSRTHEGLTRFANSAIHQNVVMDETESTVLYVLDKKIGILYSIGKDYPMLMKLVNQNSRAVFLKLLQWHRQKPGPNWSRKH